MTTPTIYMHVGHGKTGSSFIQSSLVLSQAALSDAGIAYPIDEKWAVAGRAGNISSGNLKPVPGELVALARRGFESGHKHVLVSSEALFRGLTDQVADDHAALLSEFPGCAIKILLYVRNPVDHVVSTYHQMIKRGGYTGSFAKAVKGYRFPTLVGQFFKSMRGRGADVTVLNYSRHSRSLLVTVEDWLGLRSGALANPPVQIVNRSMTLAELELQRHFNIAMGESARRYASDPLCNLLPDIRSETPPLAPEDLEAFIARMMHMVQEADVVSAIPPDEAYEVPLFDDIVDMFRPRESTYPFAFSSDQLRVVVEAVKTEMDRQLALAERRHRLALRSQ